ncbi:Dabb family protein [Chloroflexi bacterium TSY]|nr:Dabb family protein [Chloroflexi bacterium TSY]
MSTSTQSSLQQLRHVVLFKFKESTTGEQIKKIENAFRALPDKIDAIHDFEWGTDVSVEDKQKGFTHCFFVTFQSEADRDVYLPHPDHQAFSRLVRPHVDDVLVIDYWMQR